MTEDEARAACAMIAGPAMPRIERFVAAVVAEAERQNLVARSSLDRIWHRHVLDSLQLARFGRDGDRHWVDIGTGAGFPGMVLALLDRWQVSMIEPRRLRADFLQHVIGELEVGAGSVIQASAVNAEIDDADVICARAVASIVDLFAMSRPFAKRSTRFVLPRGSNAPADVAHARLGWHGLFHVEQSQTDPASAIVLADEVAAR